jgi:polysaccharide biosynthesis/export protein
MTLLFLKFFQSRIFKTPKDDFGKSMSYTCLHTLSLFVFTWTALVPGRVAAQSVDNLPTQPVGVHDLISISVYGAPEFSKTVRVSSAGEITLPVLKSAIRADGLLPKELEAAVATALETEKLLVKPSVTVTIAEYRSRTVSVLGAVHKPVSFQHVGPITLSEALTRADGLLPDAGDEILIIHNSGGPSTEASPKIVDRISAKRLLDARDPSQDVQLKPGDQIRVPVAEKIFIVGSVRKPGAFRAENAENTTVLSMLAVSEGLLPFAAKTAYVYRKAAEGRKEMAVDLTRILQRKAADVELQPGDLFYVPDNKGRRLTMTTIDRIVNFGAGTGSGMLIWRR